MPKDTASDCASGLKEEFAELSGPGPSKLSTERDAIEESRGRGCPTLEQFPSSHFSGTARKCVLGHIASSCPSRTLEAVLPVRDLRKWLGGPDSTLLQALLKAAL